MNAQEFYKYIVSNPDLEKALEDAIDSGNLEGFIKEKGCTATAEELTKYIADNS